MKRLIKRALLWTGIAFGILIILGVARGIYVYRDRTPGYSLDLRLGPNPAPSPLRAGFGRQKINPVIGDPKKPVWMAGFSQNRAATKLHDDLWAVACVLDDGTNRVGLVALDAIGFFHDDVLAVRKACEAAWELDYVTVCSTHNHSTPDLMGLWGPSIFKTGVDPDYRRLVIANSVRALGEAVAKLEPVRMAAHEIAVPADGLVADTRKPIVFDPDVRLLHFTHPGDGRTVGTIIGWANHPETVWAKNTEVTSDFCGYLRDALEHGVSAGGQVLAPGVGGIHLYVNGAVGGLMTTGPGVTVRDPYLGKDFKKPSHEKARAVGRQLASRLLPLLTNAPAAGVEIAGIGVRARTFLMPLENLGYFAASYLGLLDRGHARWKQVRTEVGLITVGDVSFACVPGEIYPEIVNGGIERAPGGDFDVDPVEVPPLREQMPGRVKFVIGLANDELGYLIPGSEWDQKPPFLYGSPERVYGEINSCGPMAGTLVHSELSALCRSAGYLPPALPDWEGSMRRTPRMNSFRRRFRSDSLRASRPAIRTSSNATSSTRWHAQAGSSRNSLISVQS